MAHISIIPISIPNWVSAIRFNLKFHVEPYNPFLQFNMVPRETSLQYANLLSSWLLKLGHLKLKGTNLLHLYTSCRQCSTWNKRILLGYFYMGTFRAC